MAINELEYRQMMNDIIKRECIPAIPLGRIAISVKLRDLYGTAEDLSEATDVVAIVKVVSTKGREGLSIAKRVRDVSAYKKFADITLRAVRISGAVTELEKIRKGYAEFYFYCWADDAAKRIVYYVFLDVGQMRNAEVIYKERPLITYRDVKFYPIPLKELFETGCVITHNLPIG